jgi:hypothetical protein
LAMGASESTADNPDCRDCHIDHQFAASIGLDRCCGQPFWPSETAKQKAVAPKLRIVRGGTTVRAENPAPVHPPATQYMRRSSASQGHIGPPRRSSTSSAASDAGSRNYLRFDNELPQNNIPPAASKDYQSEIVDAPRKLSSYNYQYGDNRINLSGHTDISISYDATQNSEVNRSSLDFMSRRPMKEITITPPRTDTHTRYGPSTDSDLICKRLRPARHRIIIAAPIPARQFHPPIFSNHAIPLACPSIMPGFLLRSWP